jgi:hypothetical protein
MKRLIAILAVVAAALLLSLSFTSTASAYDHPVQWTGQGTTDGELNTELCGTENGAEVDGSYLLWVLTAGPNATAADITGPWGTAQMTQTGGSWKYVSQYYDPASLAGQVSATYQGPLRNAQLTISHGCLAEGAITVHKTAKHAAADGGVIDLDGVTFTVDGVSNETDANGEVCFDGLAFGDYDVTETVPDGYHAVENPKSVTVDNSATCDESPYAGETVEFENNPLTDLTVTVDSQIEGGTDSQITCTPPGAPDGYLDTDATGDGTLTLEDLEPGTYDCEVVIDP